MKAPTVLELVWEHDLVLGGRSNEATMTLDSKGVAGPSPVQALCFGIAGCMAMDVVHILVKGRHDLKGLKVELSAERAQDHPHRLTSVALKYLLTGDVPKEPVQRAIDLSRDKYCSVWHSLRQDIPLSVSFTIAPGV